MTKLTEREVRAALAAEREYRMKVVAERDAMRGALMEMRAYINKYVTLTDSERWLLTTVEAALPD